MFNHILNKCFVLYLYQFNLNVSCHKCLMSDAIHVVNVSCCLYCYFFMMICVKVSYVLYFKRLHQLKEFPTECPLCELK